MELFTFQNGISLLTLTLLEIVLGIDNMVFISIVTRHLPVNQQKYARRLGLGLACIVRLLLLALIRWLMSLTEPLFIIYGFSLSLRDIIFIMGGLYLLVAGTLEMHRMVEINVKKHKTVKKLPVSFLKVIMTVVVFDIVFSLDSIFTAIAMAQMFLIMAIAIIIAIILMIIMTDYLNNFIKKYPTIEILALSFLLLIGVVLVADGLHFHISRWYVYFAIIFSIMVESINICLFKRRR